MKHLSQLDGVRGVAILIVVLGHLAVFNFGLGIGWLGSLPPLGVDIFFVLSGFLITRILLNARDEPHFFRSFYIRRALRIWPLYFVFLAFLFAVANHRMAALSFDENRLRWPIFAVYAQNVFYKTASRMGTPALAITWSLAVEEQFYAVWPFIVRGLSIRILHLFLFAVIVMAPVARFLTPRLGMDPYINPLCRFDAMAMGGLVAIWIEVDKPSKAKALKASWLLLAFAIFLGMAGYFTGVSTYLSKTAACIAFTGGLTSALYSCFLARVLNNPVLRLMGKLSYCMYLVHLIVAAIAIELWPGETVGVRLFRIAVIASGTFGIAALSWRFVEKPLLRLKRYFPSGDVAATKRSGVPPGSMLAKQLST